MDATSLINKDILKELLKTHNKQDIFKIVSKEIDILNQKDNDKIVEEKLVDKTSDKYKVLLKLINQILTSIDMEEIDDLRGFKHVDRKDLINDTIKKIIDEMSREIFVCFDKKECGWYKRNQIDCYTLSILRHLINNLGFKFTLEKKSGHVNNKAYSKIFYSILPAGNSPILSAENE